MDIDLEFDWDLKFIEPNTIILWIKKVNPMEVKLLVQEHTGSKYQSHALYLGSPI